MSAFLLDADKTYRARARFGLRTSTGDRDGDVVGRASVAGLSPVTIQRELEEFRGEIEQVPPMWSALKVDGKRLHEIARQGGEVERQPRRVTIHRLELEDFAPAGFDPSTGIPEADLLVTCSKGTYIRTLVEDLAVALGTVAHTTKLRRLAVGPWGEGCTMYPADEISRRLEAHGESACDRYVLGIDSAFPHWPVAHLDSHRAVRFVHGQAVEIADPVEGDVRVVLTAPEGSCFLGLGTGGRGVVRPRRVLVDVDRLPGRV